MEELPECAVCLEKLTNGLSCTPCGNVFHKNCIIRCLELNGICPVCRKEVLHDQVIDMLFKIGEDSKPKINKSKSFFDQMAESVELFKS